MGRDRIKAPFGEHQAVIFKNGPGVQGVGFDVTVDGIGLIDGGGAGTF